MDQSCRDKVLYKGVNLMWTSWSGVFCSKEPIINESELNMHNKGMLRTIEDHMYSTMQVSTQVTMTKYRPAFR